VGWGDAPGWIGLLLVLGALVFSGLQLQQTRRQSEQTERALVSSTAAHPV
jgi:hypothetical protein